MDRNKLKEKLKNIVFNTLEIRKAIDECLLAKEQNISFRDIVGTSKKEVDASVWNDLGLFFLHNQMYLDALKIYEHMLQTILNVESTKGLRIHKGLPLHNMGVAQINLRNYDEGIPNVLRAYEEDIETFGIKEAERLLAYRVKEGLFDFTSRVIDNNYLKDFNEASGLKVQSTSSLMQNMDEAEKLFFAKIVNSKKLVAFHDDIYTRVTMFDNLKNLCLILESNLKRRSRRSDMLPGLIVNIFSKEEWKGHFEANKALTSYRDLSDFQNKIEQIEKLQFTGKIAVDFMVSNFLTTALVRNFTAHYLNEKLDILRDPSKYDRIFAREIFSILYSLSYTVR
jgi:tetratricopeptide (TPR) repeat protein